jgi:pyruvate,water dikinase
MAVLIQEMVQSTASGTCFTVDPINKDPDEMRVSACYGLGDLLVSGKIIPDEYLIFAHDLKIMNKSVGQQAIKLECRGGRNVIVPVAEALQGAQKITDQQILEISRIAMKIAKILGFPVDIEWGIQDDVINILQARPITNL